MIDKISNINISRVGLPKTSLANSNLAKSSLAKSSLSKINLPFIPAGGTDALKKSGGFASQGLEKTFDSIFSKELDKLKFSAHALKRINSRDINLGANEMQRLDSALSTLKQKGAKESLVILDKNAFIVNVNNKTVITAISDFASNGKAISNIDSAIMA